ncbi:MAG: alpha-ketoglutarate-dependent dioxygenase AlkB family protein [Bacteriovoracaceae bacterium]
MLSIGPRNSDIENLLPKDGVLTYRPGVFPPDEAHLLLEKLISTIEWSQPSIKLYGKSFPMPRLSAWYGDEGTTYKYSGILNIPLPWTRELLLIKKKTEEATGTTYNSVLLNYYRSGADHMSWHADDEKSLRLGPVIASISLGETRKFSVKHKHEKLPTISLSLDSGSLVVMKGKMQDSWLHRINPSKRVTDPRINLTFRNVTSA